MLQAFHRPIRESASIRSALSRPSLVVIACVMLSAMTAPPIAADDDPQLKVIRDGYVRSITSIRNVWCRYEIRREPANPKGQLFGPKRVMAEWATEGDNYHFSFCPIPAENEAEIPYRPTWWESTDGKDFWTLQYIDEGKIDYALKRQLKDGTWSMRGKPSPGQFLGLYFNVGKYNKRGLTLQSILKTVPVKLGSVETIEGHQCWRVDFDYPGESPEHDIPMTVFFDRSANYLPRRLIQHSTSGGDPAIRTILEFSTFKSPDGESVYFPVKMLEEHPVGISRIKVLQVKLNEKLPETLYRPQLPEGVEVYDLDNASDVEALRLRRRR